MLRTWENISSHANIEEIQKWVELVKRECIEKSDEPIVMPRIVALVMRGWLQALQYLGQPLQLYSDRVYLNPEAEVEVPTTNSTVRLSTTEVFTKAEQYLTNPNACFVILRLFLTKSTDDLVLQDEALHDTRKKAHGIKFICSYLDLDRALLTLMTSYPNFEMSAEEAKIARKVLLFKSQLVRQITKFNEQEHQTFLEIINQSILSHKDSPTKRIEYLEFFFELIKKNMNPQQWSHFVKTVQSLAKKSQLNKRCKQLILSLDQNFNLPVATQKEKIDTSRPKAKKPDVNIDNSEQEKPNSEIKIDTTFPKQVKVSPSSPILHSTRSNHLTLVTSYFLDFASWNKQTWQSKARNASHQDLYVFNLTGNNLRIIAKATDDGVIEVLDVLTHADYDDWWQNNRFNNKNYGLKLKENNQNSEVVISTRY